CRAARTTSTGLAAPGLVAVRVAAAGVCFSGAWPQRQVFGRPEAPACLVHFPDPGSRARRGPGARFGGPAPAVVHRDRGQARVDGEDVVDVQLRLDDRGTVLGGP